MTESIAQSTPLAPEFAKSPLAVLEQIWAERKAKRMTGRTAEEIDTDIQAMRSEWESRDGELDRLHGRELGE
jgi:hypothetical protein